MSKKRALIPEKNQPNDYILRPGEHSVWITVDNFAVYVCRTDEGVVVDIHAIGHEDEDSITGTYAFTEEALDRMEEEQLYSEMGE